MQFYTTILIEISIILFCPFILFVIGNFSKTHGAIDLLPSLRYGLKSIAP